MFLEQITQHSHVKSEQEDKPYIMIIIHIIAIYSWVIIYMMFKEYVSHNSVIFKHYIYNQLYDYQKFCLSLVRKILKWQTT